VNEVNSVAEAALPNPKTAKQKKTGPPASLHETNKALQNNSANSYQNHPTFCKAIC